MEESTKYMREHKMKSFVFRNRRMFVFLLIFAVFVTVGVEYRVGMTAFKHRLKDFTKYVSRQEARNKISPSILANQISASRNTDVKSSDIPSDSVLKNSFTNRKNKIKPKNIISSPSLLYIKHFSKAFIFPKNKEDLCDCLKKCAKNNAKKASLDLLVFVTSGTNHFDHRQAIRETWGKELFQKNIVCVFLLGKSTNNSLQNQIEKEDATHKDIVQANFVDNYKNLTLKTVSMMKWISIYCSWAEFVLKTDDDMLINVEAMMDFISYIRNESRIAIFGKLARGFKPHHEKKSKWFVSKNMYPHRTYPDFVTGPSYLIQGNITRTLYETSLEEPYFPLEDVFMTGIIASKLNIPLKHQRSFNTKRNRHMSSSSFRQLITSHKYSPNEIRLLWSKLQV